MSGKALDDFIAKYLPTAQHMQIRVENYDGSSLRLHAPLAPSINDKLTAFGGSIYAWITGLILTSSLLRPPLSTFVR